MSDKPPTPPEEPGRETWLNRTVLGAGITSGLADLSYETSNVLLPGFLTALGLPPVVLGTIEGAADGLASFTKLAAGYIADRLGMRKPLVLLGYTLTVLMQALFALATGWPLLQLARMVGWFGRGIRGPLRDAIISEAITPATRGRAFGFHRAADTVGAVLGPLIGVVLLAWLQSRYGEANAEPFRLVFWLTLIPGGLAVLSFALLVRDDRSVPNPGLRLSVAVGLMPASFRRYLVAVGIFGMGDFAPTLLNLAAIHLLTQTREWRVEHATALTGLLYVGRNVFQTIAAYVGGALADRVGHRPVLVAGYAVGTLMVLLLMLAFAWNLASVLFLALIFALAGVCAGVQDALEASMTADYVPAEIRGLGYGVLGTVNGVGDLLSSLMVGFLWTYYDSPVIGFGSAAAIMALGTVALMRLRK